MCVCVCVCVKLVVFWLSSVCCLILWSWNFIFENCFENLSRKFKFHQNLTTGTGTLHEDRQIVLIISRSVVLRVRNVSDKSCTENQNTHFVFSNFFISFENRAVYEIMWKNIVERGRSQMTIQRMRVACWIPNATNTHSEYVILIAFALRQWWHKRPSVLRICVTLFVHCLSC